MISAQIARLKIRGYRRFQEPIAFELTGPDGRPSRRFLIAGPNGCGKTSFLEAALWALGREEWIHGQLQPEDRRRWLRSSMTADAEVSLALQVDSAPGTILGPRTPCRLELTRTPTAWGLTVGDERQSLLDDEAEIRKVILEISLEWFSSWRQPYLPGPVRPLAELPERAHGEAGRLWRLKQRLVDEQARSAFGGPPGRTADWLESLNRAWIALRGDDGTRLVLNLAAGEEGLSHIDLWIEREVPEFGAQRIFPIDQLSSGELEWLALVGTLITGGGEGIVLIDEPELHLHPEWQARLLPALEQVVPGSQIILATHADPPWDQVYSYERLLLVSAGDPRAEGHS